MLSTRWLHYFPRDMASKRQSADLLTAFLNTAEVDHDLEAVLDGSDAMLNGRLLTARHTG